MRTAAYKVDVVVRPPQARVSQAKLCLCFQRSVIAYGTEHKTECGSQCSLPYLCSDRACREQDRLNSDTRLPLAVINGITNQRTCHSHCKSHSDTAQQSRGEQYCSIRICTPVLSGRFVGMRYWMKIRLFLESGGWSFQPGQD